MHRAFILCAAVVPAAAFLPAASFLPSKNIGSRCLSLQQDARKSDSNRFALRMGWLDGFTLDKMYGAAPGSKVDQVNAYIRKWH
jgi:hypothetical protein